MRVNDIERFMQRVERVENGCWLWTGTVHKFGYGVARHRGHRVRAHRLAYELFIGPVPDGLTVDHVCHNGSGCDGGHACLHRRCVNPAHLEAVTNGVNVLRGESPLARHARKTHCPRDHEYTSENTRVYRGKRYCRACHRDYERTRRAEARKAVA
jgi:hypothetical protein